MTNLVKLELQLACDVESLPAEDEIRRWLEAAVSTSAESGRVPWEIVVRVVDEQESRELNRRYRQQDRPTNVLAFPAGEVPWGDAGPEEARPLGDLVICGPVVEREARAQGKELAGHWGHLLVHGALHLLGHDHRNDEEAAAMERLEARILTGRGYQNPYTAR
jgi:probable rRNA maturation factor